MHISGDREGGRKRWRNGGLTGILASCVHGSHPGALLTASSLLHGVENEVGQKHLMVAAQDLSVHIIIDT